MATEASSAMQPTADYHPDTIILLACIGGQILIQKFGK
jgi:hypothetical protein